MRPCVYCSVIYNSLDAEAAQVPANRQLGEEEVVRVYHGILLGHEKNDILPL